MGCSKKKKKKMLKFKEMYYAEGMHSKKIFKVEKVKKGPEWMVNVWTSPSAKPYMLKLSKGTKQNAERAEKNFYGKTFYNKSETKEMIIHGMGVFKVV